MTHPELVEGYIAAWNRRDVAAALDLMHPGAAYYDAFWMETCIGRHLSRYLEEALAEDPYQYEMVGELTDCESGVAFCYAALDGDTGEKCFEGAEVLTIRDGKILTLTDYYHDPDPVVLREVARLAETRHGLPTYVHEGHGAYKNVRVKRRLFDVLHGESTDLADSLTLADLSRLVGCTVDHLLTILNNEFATDTQALTDPIETISVSAILPELSTKDIH